MKLLGTVNDEQFPKMYLDDADFFSMFLENEGSDGYRVTVSDEVADIRFRLTTEQVESLRTWLGAQLKVNEEKKK